MQYHVRGGDPEVRQEQPGIGHEPPGIGQGPPGKGPWQPGSRPGRPFGLWGGVLGLIIGVTAITAAVVLVLNYALPGPPRSVATSDSHHAATLPRGAEGAPAGEQVGTGVLPGAGHKAARKGTKTTGTQSGVTGGVLFGGIMPLAIRQSSLGRRLAIIRSYYLLGEQFPSAMDARMMAAGATELVSYDTVPGGPTYASIAAGNEDGEILAFLKEVNRTAAADRLGAIYIDFEHEANSPPHHTGLGTAPQFIQAWDHVHQLAVSAHLDWNDGGRLHWVLILTHVAYLNGSASAYWPGANEVDGVAADGYNTGNCRGNGKPSVVTPASLFDSVIGFASSHGGLPVFIAEWGSVNYSSASVRPAFIHAMQEFVAANPEIVAAMYWDGHVPGCNYSVNNSPSSMAALAAMGQASDMQAWVPLIR